MGSANNIPKKKNIFSQYFLVIIAVLMIAFVIANGLIDQASDQEPALQLELVTDEHQPETYNVSKLQYDFGGSAPSSDTSPSEYRVSFTEVEDALMMAKLDQYGALVLDEHALISLNLVVSRLPENLSQHDIEKIQKLIIQALPGEAGEQVADVLANYYWLKEAEKEWLKDGMQADSLQAALDQLEAISTLRQDYLGQEVANQLFAQQQQQASLALQRLAIQQDANLNPQQKEVRLAALKGNDSGVDSNLKTIQDQQLDQLNNELQDMRLAGATNGDIHNKRIEFLGEQAANQVKAMELQQQEWQDRYQKYQYEKQYIMDSALSEHDKQQQVEALLSTYYSSDELAGARAYDAQQHY